MRTSDAVGVAALVMTVAACAAPAPEKEKAVGCEGRGETLHLGMSKQSPDGAMTASLLAADPLPPLQGPNLWTVEVRTSSGDPVVDATRDADFDVTATISMVEHAHDITRSASMTEPGVYEIPEFPITMVGYWEVIVVARQDGAENDDADVPMTFGFCITP